MGIEALLETMNKLRDLHVALFDLAVEKTPILVRNAVDELNAIVNKEGKLLRGIAELERERIQRINEYLLARGYNPNPKITISDLVKVIFKADDKLALAESQKNLVATLAKLKERNSLNQKLVEQSLAFIDYSLDLVIGAPEDDMMYQNPQRQKSNNRLGIFDTRA
ncbi:flagellar protein FlgN [Paenibacillus sp. LjRoot56]|uniref:flagellar protein FlgN n=1 Tax=Paenibacillus sp. LjRoot56 TaxID=3342333 RepID=UPI003ECDCFF2